MAQRNPWMPRAVATLTLVTAIAHNQMGLANDARAANARHAGHPAYPGPELPPAVREYLVQLSQQRPIDPRIPDLWRPNGLTPKQREDKALAIYRADHKGAEPPQLTYAESERALRDYATSPALSNLVRDNAHCVDVFSATWFPGNGPKPRGNPEYAVEVSVTPAGCIQAYTNIWDWAEQGGVTGPHPPEFLSTVRHLLATLPPGEKHPLPERLLIVTFRTASGWETRLYDRTRMPPSLAQIFNAIGRQQPNHEPTFDYAAMVAK